MDELLQKTFRPDLPSPYLQSLVELIVQMRKNLEYIWSPKDQLGRGYPKDMPLFDKVVEVSELIPCFLHRSPLPERFLLEMCKLMEEKPEEQVSFL